MGTSVYILRIEGVFFENRSWEWRFGNAGALHGMFPTEYSDLRTDIVTERN